MRRAHLARGRFPIELITVRGSSRVVDEGAALSSLAGGVHAEIETMLALPAVPPTRGSLNDLAGANTWTNSIQLTSAHYHTTAIEAG
jgi:hypothetical protein